MAIDVSKQVAKAEKAFSQRKYDMAIEIFIQSLEIDPNNRAARRGIRLAALKKHEHSYPSSMSIKLGTTAARMGMMQRNPDRKMSACEAYLKVDPKNVKVAYTLGETAEKAGYTDAAIGVYEAMIEHAPKEIEAYVALGRLLGPKEPEPAIEYLEKALKLNPKHQQAIKIRKDLAAELSIKRTGFETARTTHDMLRDKKGTMNRLNEDRIHRSDAQAGDLLSRLRAAADANPGDRATLLRLAQAYASSNKYDEALQTYRKMIENDSGDFDARVRMGDLRIARLDRQLTAARQKGDEALISRLEEQRLQVQIEEFAARVAEHPTDLALRYQLGQAYFRDGQIDPAIGEFQKAIKDPRKRFDSLRMLGDCFMEKGLYDLAANQLDTALAESPGLNSESGKAVVYSLGLLRQKQGDLASAKAQFVKIYAVDIGFRDVADKVTEISQQMSQQG